MNRFQIGLLKDDLKILPLVWIVNLQRSPDRRRFMAEQMNNLMMDFVFIDAVDGKALTLKQRSLYSPLQALTAEGRLLSAAEIGCALTHAKIYQRMLAENYEEILVLEDDVVFNGEFVEVLKVRKRFPANWEVINFLSDSSRVPLSRPPLLSKFKVCTFKGNVNRTAAYLLRKSGAEKLMEHIFPIRYPADGFLGRTQITGIMTYGLDPQPVSLADFSSDIWEDSQPAWEKPGWQYTKRWVRRIKRLLGQVWSKIR